MKSDVVIVNWNAGQQLADCIASVLQHAGDSLGACIVVGNGSTDGPADFLNGAFQLRGAAIWTLGRLVCIYDRGLHESLVRSAAMFALALWLI